MEYKIGWIGTGVMGKQMCLHVLTAGNTVTVYNRTREKAGELIAAGAIWAESPKEVAAVSDIVFTIVGFPDDVKQVFLGTEGVLAGAKSGSILVDMTTSIPDLAKTIAAKAKSQGVVVLDAPVSGGDVGARDGRLAIMAGGDKEAFKAVLPVFETFGEHIAYMGPAGTGQHTKMCNQILIAANMAGVVESLLYAQKAGLSQDEVIAIVGKGAAGSFSINKVAPRIVKNDFDPGFYIKHFVKDMGIALSECRRMNLSLPCLALVYQFYIAAIAIGFENLGVQALYRVCARMNGME
ncbi:MAG: NAD(P)-dependent oxidoreductase [Spirochaetales bacterium]|nr:NAD(P)-dependent oxidoreductase [Spirochaetales bacterium]